jgi:hypothetical protein
VSFAAPPATGAPNPALCLLAARRRVCHYLRAASTAACGCGLNCCCSAALAGFIIAHGRPCCDHRELPVRTAKTTTTTTTASRRVPLCRPHAMLPPTHPATRGSVWGPKPGSQCSLITLCGCANASAAVAVLDAPPTVCAAASSVDGRARNIGRPSLSLTQRPFVPPPRHWLCPPRRRACTTSHPAAHRESSEWACRRGLLIPSAAPLQDRLPSSRGRRRSRRLVVLLLDCRGAASRLLSHHILLAA